MGPSYQWTTVVRNRRISRWTHPGVSSLPDGGIAISDPARPGILLLDASGQIRHRIVAPVSEVHGLAAGSGPDGMELWVVDPGFELEVRGGRIINRSGVGHVAAMRPDGTVVRTITAPPIPIHTVHEAGFGPTAIAVYGEDFGGPGDVWIADGYGTGLIHRYDRDGTYRATITGEEGRAGAFRNPHALLIVERAGAPELVIADRHNSRLQVYDLGGRFKRAISHERLVTPSALAFHQDRLYVAELQGGIVVLDEHERYVHTILERTSPRPAGWPNVAVDGRIVRPELQRDRLNSPHGIAVGLDGSIYVAEWVQGGRVTRLEPVAGSIA